MAVCSPLVILSLVVYVGTARKQRDTGSGRMNGCYERQSHFSIVSVSGE